MSLLHDAYTALLSGLTTKTGNEIHWQNEHGVPITIEPVDVSNEKYIVRYYYSSGNRGWEAEYQNVNLHGKYIVWRENGNKDWELEYQNGQRHGKYIEWYPNGNKNIEKGYQNNELHGKYIKWDIIGNKKCEEEYKNGKLHSKFFFR